MYDSILNVGDFFSDHWLAEVYPGKLSALTKVWKEDHEHGKHTPWHGLQAIPGMYLKARAELEDLTGDDHAAALTDLHSKLLASVGVEAQPFLMEAFLGGQQVDVPLLARIQGPAGEMLHVLEAQAVESVDALFGDEGRLVRPLVVHETATRSTEVVRVTDGIQRLILTDHAPRYLLVLAGSWVLLTDAARWVEGRYLAFDVSTALARRDTTAKGELACHAGLWSAAVLLPGDEGQVGLDVFTDDSVRHAIGVSEDLRDGLRVSVELIANEVLRARRAAGQEVEAVDDLPRELTSQSLRFLYRILFLLYAEARPELGVLPVGAPEYSSGYGLDRLRDLAQAPLTDRSREGTHLHDSLRLLFRLVNDGHDGGDAGLVFEPLRADLFEPRKSWLIDEVRLRNDILQQVLALLLLSRPKAGSRGRKQAGYISYALLGINQLGAVYEGLMSYSGFIADQELLELAKDGDSAKGTWLVPVGHAGEYNAKHVVRREDRITGEKRNVIHAKGSFVYRLSGRERQRSASYYTPELLTRCVVKHALAELITAQTTADNILELRICEPALGSGAFLNEVLNQLATIYLRKREEECGEPVPPEQWQEESQRVKAWLALHRCYGVDLNQTAVELAEVSLWLNVMYPGLQAPWFGLHLRRGNSLIGARRATYDLTALAKAKKTWWKEVPRERHLATDTVPTGEVHHFLLPSADWGSVASTKQAKELRPDEAERLRYWAREIKKRPDKQQTDRIRGLAARVERLWLLAQRRLEVSEAEIARSIDLWGKPASASQTRAASREQVERELFDLDGPYQRLRLVMDAWCALWYWPVTLDPDETAPPSLDEWLDTLEELLGVAGRATADEGFHELAWEFDQLAKVDAREREFTFMKDVTGVVVAHPWLGVARDIAQREGFFHWELDFAHVFARGGFDLQVGNPPWVQPKWRDDVTLAEHDPYFQLTEPIPDKVFKARRSAVLADPDAERTYLHDVESWCGTAEHLGSAVEHPVLTGVQTNLYTNFMERTWANNGPAGVVGLLHPESHFNDPKAALLREAAYRRLRRHWQFVNALFLFPEVHDVTFYGVQIYGVEGAVCFSNATNLKLPAMVDDSFDADPSTEVPGIQYPWGGWDLRPHASRIMTVTVETLAEWAALFDPPGTPGSQARMVRPLTEEHLAVLATLARADTRMADTTYWWTSGWHEKGAKEDGFIEWRTGVPASWEEVVLQGPHFTVSTPFAKQPNEHCRHNQDYSDWDLESLPESVVPRTNYQRACGRDRYDGGLTHWNGRPCTDYWRLAWRAMTQPGLERSLHSALIPPGPAHIHGAGSLAFESRRTLVGNAGLWASIPVDYLVKVSGKAFISDELFSRFPASVDQRAMPYLFLRTLRLNCLTREYSSLWEELFEERFADDAWTGPFRDLPPLSAVAQDWTMSTPLRTDRQRRAALVEIDALAAITLGLSAGQLALMYRAQFPVLRKYEYEMYFDANGRKVCGHHQSAGVRQGKDDYKLVKAWVDAIEIGEEPKLELPDLYVPPFTRPDREAEMRAAHAEFAERLGIG